MREERGSSRDLPRLGVLLPCRNESAVLGRKLANLARCEWPASHAPHRLLVVDDGSSDGTLALAEELCARLFGPEVRAEAIVNRVRAGKAGAIEQGLRALQGECEVVVLSDADVVLGEDALCELARAFAREPRLGMACGAQTFVRSLAADGSFAGAGGGALVEAPGVWDLVTARVRRLESRFGLLFSVHGQLLAWRAELSLSPSAGVAADDIDLCLQVRERHPRLRVRLVEGARFLEEKPAPGARADGQALRRARAYVQVFRAHPEPPRRPLAARVQWHLYRHLPFAAPWAALGAALALPFFGAAWLGAGGALGAILALAIAARARTGRELLRILTTIAAAERLEAQAGLPEQWEMERS